MPTILADENIPLLDTLFSQLGTVTTLPGREIRSQHLAGVDILLVRSVTRVDRNLLRDSAVKFVGSCTIGTDHLDRSYLDKMGIAWANAPGCNANAVVQYVFSAMAALVSHWDEKVVGIIGCGNVGSRLLACLQAMGVKCLCYDPLIAQDKPELTTFNEVLTADIISCHTPLTTSGCFPTYHLISENELVQLQPGALLINTSRGAVVDNTALLGFLKQRPDFKVALDVWENEPDINSQLLARVDIGTPHIAGHSLEGKRQGSVQVYRALSKYLQVDTGDSAALIATQPKQLNPPKKNDVRSQQNAILLDAYNIIEDNLQLRRWYNQQQEAMPVFFERLRKNYPVRRDYSHCLLPDWLGKQHKRFLKALGFNNR